MQWPFKQREEDRNKNLQNTCGIFLKQPHGWMGILITTGPWTAGDFEDKPFPSLGFGRKCTKPPFMSPVGIIWCTSELKCLRNLSQLLDYCTQSLRFHFEQVLVAAYLGSFNDFLVFHVCHLESVYATQNSFTISHRGWFLRRLP